ncbi:MAG: SRPBCC family protein [Gammaproteobacteria bacterium]
MKNSRQQNEERRADSRSRLVDAPPEAVFDAFSDPEKLARWWGPEGFSSTFEEFDLRAGGYWRFTMHGPDGTDYPNESRFLEVEADRRIVVEHLSAHHFIPTISFTPAGQSTRVGWRQVFDTVEHYDAIAEFIAGANEQNLDRLQAVVEGRG